MVEIVLTVANLVASWLVFKKMGREGWEGIIPFYNLYVLFEMLYGDGVKALTLLIPFYNIYVLIKSLVDLAHAFNKPTSFGVGLVLLEPVFMLILAFSNDAQYGDGQHYVDAKEEISKLFK